MNSIFKKSIIAAMLGIMLDRLYPTPEVQSGKHRTKAEKAHTLKRKRARKHQRLFDGRGHK